jgi:hypothetical protein
MAAYSISSRIVDITNYALVMLLVTATMQFLIDSLAFTHLEVDTNTVK